MLLSLARKEMWDCVWASALAAFIGLVASCLLDGLSPGLRLLSGPGPVIVGGVLFFGCTIVSLDSALPLWLTHIILEDALVDSGGPPKAGRVEWPWRKRTQIRHIEALKAELLEIEERFQLINTIEDYIGYYKKLPPLMAEVTGAPVTVFILEKSRAYFSRHFGADTELAAELVERLDSVFAGDVEKEIRLIEERLDALRFERAEATGGFKSTINRLEAEIRGCERDRTELRSWQASKSGVQIDTPQRKRFEQAKTIEYDNERIRVWALHAKFKAEEERLSMRREESDKIERRVARGELTRREADYLLGKLNEYFGEHDDRIFA